MKTKPDPWLNKLAADIQNPLKVLLFLIVLVVFTCFVWLLVTGGVHQ